MVDLKAAVEMKELGVFAGERNSMFAYLQKKKKIKAFFAGERQSMRAYLHSFGLSSCVSIRPHTSAYVRIRQHTSAYIGFRG